MDGPVFAFVTGFSLYGTITVHRRTFYVTFRMVLQSFAVRHNLARSLVGKPSIYGSSPGKRYIDKGNRF